MPSSLRTSFADLCRSTRLTLDITQADLARAARVSRAQIAAIETGRANPSLDHVARIGEALGLELDFLARPPVIVGSRQRDLVHARCSAYVQRRLESAGLLCAREVEIAGGRFHGWIDVLAFDPTTGTLYVIEIKTTLEDLGGAERQLGWYERHAASAARTRGWDVRRVRSWLLCLASAEVDGVVQLNRDALRIAFPVRAGAMRDGLAGARPVEAGRGLALIDPSRRRHDWLLPSRVDGRRRPAPYRDYADAVSHWRTEARSAGMTGTRPAGRAAMSAPGTRSA
ncbi:MAG TPA: helix-turn-helix domain-containing protein [Candidatus Sulfomarinibacteraceae bacterium]|nr:helix-turn-helix domain-containing protein [Candidatus Sulfomarinibacteraceae bacterium]